MKFKCPGCGSEAVVQAAVQAGPVDQLTAALTGLDSPEALGEGPTDSATCDLNATIAAAGEALRRETQRNDRTGAPEAEGAAGSWRPDGYRILRELGQGGMGTIYEAEDTKLERRVSLKVMKPEIARNPQHRDRFLREACTAASVESVFICPIYEVGEHDGIPFIAMPFLQGEALNDHWKQNPRLALADVLRIGREIAEGLSVAHEAGLVHRDIKPANIWLETQSSGPPRAIILDFGLARVQADNAPITQSGVIVGTPAFMSPEQARGNKDVDARTDLFSLGCVLYALCTGELPFKGKQMMDVLLALATQDPAPPHTIAATTPPPLSELILRLLAKRPDDRPATARVVIEELKAIEREFAKPAHAAITARIKPSATFRGKTRPIAKDADTTEVVARGAVPAAPARKTSRAFYALLAVTLLGCVIPLGGGGLFYVVTDKGTIEIQAENDNVRLSLLKNGAEMEILDAATQKSWSIRAGTYAVRLKDDAADMEIVMPNTFELKRGGKHVVTIRKPAGPVARAFTDADIKRIAALPVADQVDEVRKELVKRNPGFDGTITPEFDGNAVKGLTFTTNRVADITPVRALTRLQSLNMKGAGDNAGALADLTPLKGLPLTALYLDFNPVQDLSPLNGMPLKTLHLMHTKVTDLRPLQGLPLETLMLWGWRGTDLTPLKGMPLQWLNCGGGRMAVDLRPLAGSALEFLCINFSLTADLTPLKNVPLKQLLCSNSRVTDLTPLQGMRLEELHLLNCKVSDVAPLQGMPLHTLDLKGTSVTNLFPLRDLPLKQLSCDVQARRDARFLLPIKTLATINGMPAERFWTESVFGPRFAPLLRGEDHAEADAERLAFARYASDQKKFSFAVRMWSEALTNDPKLGDDRAAQHRYHAARAALLAAAGQGDGEPPLDEAAKAKLRGQGHDWLKAELSTWTKLAETGPLQERPNTVAKLIAWRQNADFAGIRDEAAMAMLPAAEQKLWQALWARVPDLRTVVPTSKDQGQTWSYTTRQPAEGWQMSDFDDKQWQQGVGGFGINQPPGVPVGTEWKTADIWLRREFMLPEGKWDDLLLQVNNDDDTEVYVNGVLATKVSGWSGGYYVAMPLSAAVRAALKPGNNVFAVHCHHTLGAQYIDVGIVAVQNDAARLAFAQLAYDSKSFASAAHLWTEALTNDPKLGDDRQAQHRYHAARAAALAAAGQGEDQLDDEAKAKLCGQALDWLKAELAALSNGQPRLATVQTLWRWQQDSDLASIRDAAALAKLGAQEQKAASQLWADVAKVEQPANNAERQAFALIAGDQLMDADAKQFAFYVPRVKAYGEPGLRVLTGEIDRKPLPPTHPDWTVRFYKWDKATDRATPAIWDAVLQAPVLDELKMPRLHLADANMSPKAPTPKVPGYQFAVVATTEVMLEGGDYVLTVTSDDGVRVWLDNEILLEDWIARPPTTKSVTVQNRRGKHEIKVEFFQASGGYHLDVALTCPDESLAQRQANAAVALLQVDHTEKVWPLLKQTPDPRVRSYLIHRLGPLGADAKAIVKQLDAESDMAIRRALLLSLGDFSAKDFPPEDRKALVPKLKEMYETATDAGLHAASEWLLRQWHKEAWLEEKNQAWAVDRQQQAKRIDEMTHEAKQGTRRESTGWYVNGQGQTLAVIPGPVTFWMGSPPAEEGRHEGPAGQWELRHWQRIGRSFAIASKEVTLAQFLRFRKDHPLDEKTAPSSDCPVNMVSWYDAAAYCNWLSAQEGIPQEQWCYEPNTQGEYAKGMKLAANCLERTGYRLPTEAEWEFACRAGAVTRYSFGESDELLVRYAWYQKNSQDRSWSVGSLKPNDLGLFDMHGSDWEWCQNELKQYAKSGDGQATEDLEDSAAITDSKYFVLRGGTFTEPALRLRSAGRPMNEPTARRIDHGLRPARTLPLSSFDRYTAARAAALAVAGAGKDQPPLDDGMKAKLRRQAIDWLKSELADWTKVQPPRLYVARNLWQWQNDRDLAGIRDQEALAKLPAQEQKIFTQFWADVAKTADPVDSADRLEFARLATLFVNDQARGEPPFDDAAKAKLRAQALFWLQAELTLAADRPSKAAIIGVAAPLEGALAKLAASAPNDGQFHTELARHFAERGNKPLADAAVGQGRALLESKLAKEPTNLAVAADLADVLLIDTRGTPIVGESNKQLAATKITDSWSRLATAYALIGRNDKAADYLGKALQADPKLGEDRTAQVRYDAARAAALAAAAQGKDEPPLDETAKAKLRGQALDWLKGELRTWTRLFDSGPVQDRSAIVAKLSAWQQDNDLAGIRDTAALVQLPADEQKEWQALWARVPDLMALAPTSKVERQTWRYTTQQPVPGWQLVIFDDKPWQQGVGAFGSKEYAVRTEWKTDDIWLRREFTLSEAKWDELFLLLDHDDDAEVYINGVLALKAPAYAMGMQVPLSEEARAALQPGKNILAVHCHNMWGPQFIDAGIVAVKNNAARLALAHHAYDQKNFALAAQLWTRALASDRQLGDDRQAQHRYHAARAAALAATRQGAGDAPLDDAAKAKLRQQAFEYLKAELTAWRNLKIAGPDQDRADIFQALARWRKDPGLYGIRDPSALTNLPAEDQKTFTQLWADVAALLGTMAEEKLAQRPDDLAAADALAGVLLEKAEPKWLTLEPSAVKSDGGATLTVQPDDSVLASGDRPDKDVYVIETPVAGRIRAIRLEVLPDPSMSAGGSGRADHGNFVLTDFRVTAGNSALTWSHASADFSQDTDGGTAIGYPIAFAIDADELTGWAIYPRVAEAHWAVFVPSETITTDGKTPLTIRLAFQSGWAKHTLGRFRLSVTEEEAIKYVAWFAGASTPHSKAGAAYLALDDCRRAADLLTKATAANPQLPAADWLVLAMAHARLKEPEQARKACRRAAELLRPTGAEAALRPLLREALIAVGPESTAGKSLLEAAAAGGPPAALTAAIHQNPDKAAGYLNRANWFVARGRWTDAIADFNEAFRLEPNAYTAMRLGVLLAYTGEVDRYRAHCQAMLDKWASTENPGEADMTLKTSILLPGFKGDAKSLARLAEVAVSGNANADWVEWYMFAKGFHDYRTGKYADALATCRESRLRAPKAKGDGQALTTLNLAVEAMACHHSGDEAGAKRALAEAKSYVEVHGPGFDDGNWQHDWLAARILYREAEALIGGKKSLQQK